MAGAIKKLMIGSFIMIFILIGGITFTGTGFTAYSVNDTTNSSTDMLSETIGYLGTLNNTAEVFTNTTSDSGAFNVLDNTWLGIVLDGMGSLLQNFNLMIGFFTVIINDLTGTSLFEMPWYVSGILLGIISVIIFIGVVAIITSRSSDDI